MPGKRPSFKESKLVEFIQLLLEAAKRGEELPSGDIQARFDFDKQRFSNFKRYAQLRIEDITGGAVTIESRRVSTTYYRLKGDPTILELELELRTMSAEERQELIRWAIEEKHRREQEEAKEPE